ncbi:MAG: FecR domain-containing protein [Nitrospirae bacterium]|nr:FecR domain-containing protein [Nitrospirota bacterium]
MNKRPLLRLRTLFRIFVSAIFMLPMVYGEVATAASKEVGNVRELRGAAYILRDKQKNGVQKNEPVFGSDTVNTAEKSRVKLLFIDDSVVMVGENSSFVVSEHLKDNKNVSVFNLIDGVMNVIVGKSRFEVRTPTAVTAARGTSYLVWVEGNKTGLAVTEGRVDFSEINAAPDKKVIIPAGRTSYIEIGKPPVVATRTNPDLIKRFYEDTLDPEERWGPVLLKATGSGIAPPGAVNQAQARLMALRAAKVDAMRNLAEQVSSVTIISDTRIQDFVTKHDTIKARVDSFIKGAWVSEERELADGTIEVDMELGLGIGFRRMFLEQADRP